MKKNVNVNANMDTDGDEILTSVSLKNIEKTEWDDSKSYAATEEKDNLKPSDKGWTEYVLSLLTPQELIDGKPTCDGLRRVAEAVMGPIVGGIAKIVQAPSPQNNMTAAVEFTIRFDNGEVWTSAADVNSNNCDPQFARFATSVAETRAEGRALRKALRLRKIITAEEPSDSYSENHMDNGKSTPTQWNFIETLCERNDIGVNKFLSEAKGFRWNGRLEDIPYKSATLIISHLSEMQRDRTKIDPKFVGFDSEWKKDKQL